MAWSIRLRVGDTSASDVVLTTTPIHVETYQMQSPEVEQATISGSSDSSNLGIPSWRNVTESIEIVIKSTAAELVSAAVQEIETILDRSRQATLGMANAKLYLRVQFDHDTEAWRSEILAARFEVAGGSNEIWRKYVRGVIYLTRRFYWETEAMQSLEVSSAATTTATTGYATVYNAKDSSGTASHRQWFQIDAAQIGGSIPAPAKIYIKNTSGATRYAALFFLGNYVYTGSTTVNPIFTAAEAEGSNTSITTTEAKIMYWEMPSAHLPNLFRGQQGRAVVVWSSLPSTTTLTRFAIMLRLPVPEYDLALGEQVLNTGLDFVQDLGALPIPPSGYVDGMGVGLNMVIKGKAATGTDTIDIDWLQIFPSGEGRYRVIKGVIGSQNLVSDNELVDDGPNGALYLLNSGNPQPLYRGYYKPIYLWPGINNRIRMLIGSNAATETEVAWGVRVETRFRRLSL